VPKKLIRLVDGSLSEKEIQKQVCEYLNAKDYFFFRNNNTPIFDPTRKVFRKMPKFALKGVSDIILIKNKKVYFIEIKTNRGTLSKDQIHFKTLCEKNGVNYFVARSVDDVIALGL
jgi:hypothetical protein